MLRSASSCDGSPELIAEHDNIPAALRFYVEEGQADGAVPDGGGTDLVWSLRGMRRRAGPGGPGSVRYGRGIRATLRGSAYGPRQVDHGRSTCARHNRGCSAASTRMPRPVPTEPGHPGPALLAHSGRLQNQISAATIRTAPSACPLDVDRSAARMCRARRSARRSHRSCSAERSIGSARSTRSSSTPRALPGSQSARPRRSAARCPTRESFQHSVTAAGGGL